MDIVMSAFHRNIGETYEWLRSLCFVQYWKERLGTPCPTKIDKKRQMLVEIVEFISTQKWWDEDILRELIHCVTSNLFRTLPLRSTRKSVKGDEEEEPFLDPEWLHLQLVYELCLRFLISNDIDKKVYGHATTLYIAFSMDTTHFRRVPVLPRFVYIEDGTVHIEIYEIR